MTAPDRFFALPRLGHALALFAAFFAAPLAAAEKNVLYKCVDVDGVTSIQSEHCPPGSTEAWRRDATPEPAPTPEQAAQADAKRLRDQQTVRELSEAVERKLRPVAPVPATVAVTAPQSSEQAKEHAEIDACQQAQAFAGAVREKDWLGLSEDQVRRLYGWVAESCKNPPAAD